MPWNFHMPPVLAFRIQQRILQRLIVEADRPETRVPAIPGRQYGRRGPAA